MSTITNIGNCKAKMSAAGWALFCDHKRKDGVFALDPAAIADDEIIALSNIELRQYEYSGKSDAPKLELPFGIVVTVGGGSGSISSNLHDKGCLWGGASDNMTVKTQSIGIADGIEGLLLALACEGVDIHTQSFVNAINATVEGAANSF